MHRATAKRLRGDIRDLEAWRDELLLPSLAGLLERMGLDVPGLDTGQEEIGRAG